MVNLMILRCVVRKCGWRSTTDARKTSANVQTPKAFCHTSDIVLVFALLGKIVDKGFFAVGKVRLSDTEQALPNPKSSAGASLSLLFRFRKVSVRPPNTRAI